MEPITSEPTRARSVSNASSSSLSSLASSNVSDTPVKKRKLANRTKKSGGSTPPTSIDGRSSLASSENSSAHSAAAWAKKRRALLNRRGGRPFELEEDVEDRKVYLTCGLYAPSAHLHNAKPAAIVNEKALGRARRQVTGKDSLTASRNGPQKGKKKASVLTGARREAAERNFSFGLPIHHGETLLAKQRDFKLPWDILNDFDLGRVPETEEGAQYRAATLDRIGQYKEPGSYKTIHDYKFIERRPDEAAWPAICQCTSGRCGDSCVNRLMQYFCDAESCPLKGRCTNLPFSQRGAVEGLEVFWTGNRGFGLRTNKPIIAGQFIIVYLGDIISQAECYRRVREEYASRSDFYFLSYYGAEVIDAGLRGNEARFINHACEGDGTARDGANVKVVRWKLADLDEYEVGMFASRDIEAGEELTYDYGWQGFSPDDATSEKHRCFCGASNCSGYMEKARELKSGKKGQAAKGSTGGKANGRKAPTARI